MTSQKTSRRLTIELSRGELLVACLMLVFTGDELVSQVLNVAASSTLYNPEKHARLTKIFKGHQLPNSYLRGCSLARLYLPFLCDSDLYIIVV